MFKASIQIKLRSSILDPQGKATHQALGSLGYSSIEQVRIGKLVELVIEETDESKARAVAKEACEKLLANQVMEDFSIELEAIEVA